MALNIVSQIQLLKRKPILRKMDGGSKGELDFEFSIEDVQLWPWDYHHYEHPGSVNHTDLYNCNLKNRCESCRKRGVDSDLSYLWTPPPTPTVSSLETEEEGGEEENIQEEETVAQEIIPINLTLSIMYTPTECKIQTGNPCFICSEETEDLLRLVRWIVQGDLLQKDAEDVAEEMVGSRKSPIVTTTLIKCSSRCSSTESDADSSKLERTFKKATEDQSVESIYPSWSTVVRDTCSYQSLASSCVGDTVGLPVSSTQSIGSHLSVPKPDEDGKDGREKDQPRTQPPRTFIMAGHEHCCCQRSLKCSYGSSSSAHADLNVNNYQQAPTTTILPGPPRTVFHVPYHAARVQPLSYTSYYPAVSCAAPPSNFYHGVHMGYSTNPPFGFGSYHHHFPQHHYFPNAAATYQCHKVQEKGASQEKLKDASGYRKSVSAPAGTPVAGRSPRGFELKSHEFPSLVPSDKIVSGQTCAKGLLSPQNKKKPKSPASIKSTSSVKSSKSCSMKDKPPSSLTKNKHVLKMTKSSTGNSLKGRERALEKYNNKTEKLEKAEDRSFANSHNICDGNKVENESPQSDATENNNLASACESCESKTEDHQNLETEVVAPIIDVEDSHTVSETLDQKVESDENNVQAEQPDCHVSEDEKSNAQAEPELAPPKEKKKGKEKKLANQARKLAAKAAKSKGKRMTLQFP